MRRILLEACSLLGVGGVLTAFLALLGLPSVSWTAPSDPDAAATCEAPDPSVPELPWITQQAAEALATTTDTVFVDARSSDEFQEGHIAEALHIPLPANSDSLRTHPTLLRASTIVVYCDTLDECARSTQLATQLVDLGYQDVRVLEGGINDWIALGYRAASGTCGECE